MLDWRQWDSHKQRLVTSAFLGVPLLLILAFGPLWSWLPLVSAAAVLGLWEYKGLTGLEPGSPARTGLYFLPALLLPLGAYLGGATGLHAALMLTLFAGFLSLLPLPASGLGGVDRLAATTLAWLYVPYPLSYVLLIGSSPEPRGWLFFTLLVVVCSDAGAYYAGRRFGRHKLYPRVSPGKTIEGSVGGLGLSMVVATLFGSIVIDGASPVGLLAAGMSIAIISMAGDLVESMIKRMSGKKDSSGLLPGHGGLLDRLDSLLFAFPAAWGFLNWLG